MTGVRQAARKKTETSLNQNSTFPREGFDQLRAEGLLQLPFTAGWGFAPGTHAALLQTLRMVGARDLALGRLYEGHVNAVLLATKYGDPDRVSDDLREGRIFGVWNTDAPTGVTGNWEGSLLRLSGCKAFASGAGSIERPIVTVEVEGEGRVMCLVPMERLSPAVDRQSWDPLGMEGSDSFTVDFGAIGIERSAVLGKAGDYYKQPAFGGGAIRFAAVQFGAADRLASDFYEWLRRAAREKDALQIARAGEIALAIEAGRLWIEQAAVAAERDFTSTDELGIDRMLRTANMTRLAIERVCLDVLERVTRGVGARGLLAAAGFEGRIRDLTMYLRQPAPDATLLEVGRSAMLEERS